VENRKRKKKIARISVALAGKRKLENTIENGYMKNGKREENREQRTENR